MGRATWYILGFLLFIGVGCVAEYELPGDMRELRDYELHYVQSSLQKGRSCAWYATLNAYAIQELYKQNIPLTEENIQLHVERVGLPLIWAHEQQLQHAIGGVVLEGLDGVQQDYLARFLGLTNYYVIQQLQNGKIYCVEQGQWRLCASLEAVLKMIKGDTTPLIHILLAIPAHISGPTLVRDEQSHLSKFVSETSYHAVLISRIKRRAPKPFLFYMDSNNSPLVHQFRLDVAEQSHWMGLFSSYQTVVRDDNTGAYLDNHMVRDAICSFIKKLDTF